MYVGEIDHIADTRAVLGFMPERLGHAVQLKQDPAFVEAILKARVPIEICPTSNLFTLKLEDYQQHPTLSEWLARGHPVVICTDDAGVFDTCLSKELLHVAKAFGLGKEDLCKLCIQAAGQVFADQEVRSELQAQLQSECNALLQHYAPGEPHRLDGEHRRQARL